jgi:predicted transcriptional regulator
MAKRKERFGLTERREVRLERELADRLREVARREDRSESNIIRRALRRYFAESTTEEVT